MDEAYGSYAADDECFDNHDYDDDTDDDNDHKNDSYTAAGAAPGADAAPGPHGSPGGTFYHVEGPAFSRPYHHQYHHPSHDCQHIHHQQKYHKFHPYLQHE